MSDELTEVAGRVREQPDLEPERRELFERWPGIVVELEMRRVRPAALHLDSGRIGVADTAHPLDDPLGEQHPDLVVVVELGVTLELLERAAARLLVARDVERQAVAEPELPVAGGAEVRPGPREGEVNVEDDRAEHRSFEDRASHATHGGDPKRGGNRRSPPALGLEAHRGAQI